MNNLATLPTALTATRALQAKQGTDIDPWQALRDDQRRRASERAMLVQRVVRDQRIYGVSRNKAIGALLSAIEYKTLDGPAAAAAAELARAGDLPNQSTLYRWCKRWESGGVLALADKYKGRQRARRGWEERAIFLWNQGQRPAYSTVAVWLRQEGFSSATDDRVRGFLKSLPDPLGGQNSPHRAGQHYYDLNFGKYEMRDRQAIPPGFVYEGDGHTCDVYVAHPNSGTAWRAELTIWLDVSSGIVTGWGISEAESFHSSLFSLVEAMGQYDHVPAGIHVDPGSGYDNLGMRHELTGFLPRMSIELMLALPGNAKGKGLVEGWFRWFEERCGKRFPTFMQARTDAAHERLRMKVDKGQIILPTLEEYKFAIDQYCRWYNESRDDQIGMSRLGYWEKHLEKVPVVTPLEELLRPRKLRTVRNWMVRLDNRWYQTKELKNYNGRQVQVEYALSDDRQVWIREENGRLICTARLKKKIPWLEASRIAEARRKRLQGQQKRLEDKAQEMKQRATPMLEHDELEAVLDTLNIDELTAIEGQSMAVETALEEDSSGGWQSALEY